MNSVYILGQAEQRIAGGVETLLLSIYLGREKERRNSLIERRLASFMSSLTGSRKKGQGRLKRLICFVFIAKLKSPGVPQFRLLRYSAQIFRAYLADVHKVSPHKKLMKKLKKIALSFCFHLVEKFLRFSTFS